MDGNNERLLTPGEVAALFRVDPKTVTRWAASGRITSIRTPGGHRRFRESEVRALLRGDSEPSPQGPPGGLTMPRRMRPPAVSLVRWEFLKGWGSRGALWGASDFSSASMTA